MQQKWLRLALMVTTSLVATGGSAWAQGAAEGGSQLEEVVVTAQRRTETVLDVPLAVSAYSQAGLDKKGVRDIGDLTRITPSITFTPGWAGSTNISIRGISSLIGAGTTGVYLDDTPIQARFLGSSAVAANVYPAIFDVERVEVLRGPQGTLFGAGSEGGTIRFLQPSPSLTSYSGYGRAELAFTEGGDPSHELGVAVGGPIMEGRVGFRLSAMHRWDGGWVDRADPDTGLVADKNSDSVETTVLRGALKFAVTDDLTVTPAIFHQTLRRRDSNQYWVPISDPSHGEFNNGLPLRQPGTDRYTLYSVGAEYNLGAATLFSNTSYFDRRAPSVADYTHYAAELFQENYLIPQRLGVFTPSDMFTGQKVFTQEVRLQSTGEQRLTWVAGVFYQKAKQRSKQDVHSPKSDLLFQTLYGATTEQVLGLPLYQPGDITFLARDSATDEQIAAFGQVDFKITDQLTATAGLRVAKTKFNFTNFQDGPYNGGPSTGAGKQSEKPVTPKVGLNYKPSEDLMFYVSAAKGFRTGGANPPVPTLRCTADLSALGLTEAPKTYNSDSVWSYEGGAKGELMNRRLRFESSVFYIDWKDIQNSVELSNCGFNYVANLGKAVSKGFDLHVTGNPVEGLTLEASVGYTHAEYTRTVLGAPSAAGVRGIIVEKGDPLTTAPWNVTLSFDYEQPLAALADTTAYLHGDYHYTSSYRPGAGPNTISFDPFFYGGEATHLASARAGVRRGPLDVSVFVDNLFDSHDVLAVTHDTTASTLFREVTFRPRTIGVTASYRY